MKRLLSLLFIVSIAAGQDYKQFIKGLESHSGRVGIRDIERELKQKAGIRTSENDLGRVIDVNKQQEILDLMKYFSSEPVREFTCYQVRTVKVNAKWKCSYDGRLFEDEATCRQNCMKQHSCNQLPCYTVQFCNELSGGYVCPIGIKRCEATLSCPPGGTYNAKTGK